ncbi:MAG: hypothetical protein CMO32_36445 [Variovorax sp.]|nr:hypothetical protein [Variovorax sp.]
MPRCTSKSAGAAADRTDNLMIGRPRGRLERVFGSLKVRLTLGGIVALALGIALSTSVLLGIAERDLLAAQQRRELGESARTAALLSRSVVQLQRALLSVAESLDEATLDDPAALARFMDSKPILRGLFTVLYIARPDGEVRILVDAENGVSRPPLPLTQRNYFRRTLAEGRAIVSEPLNGPLSGEPIVVFTQPARNASGIYAVFGGVLRLSSRDLLDGLVDPQAGDDNALLVVTTLDGRVLAHPDRRRIMGSLTDEPRLGQAFKAWTAEHSPAEPAGVALPQPGEIASAAGVAGPDWMVWRTRPQSELTAPFATARAQSLRWAGLIVAPLALGLLALLWWGLRPLRLLERRAQHLFDGSMGAADGWPRAGGEIGQLGNVLRRVGIQRAELERLNGESIAKLGSVMRAAPVGIALVRDGRFDLASDELCRLLGCAREDLLGRLTGKVLVPPEPGETPLAALEALAFGADQAYVGECQVQRPDGSRFWARLRSKPVDVARMELGTIWILTDIDQQRRIRAALEWSAAHDSLTGLANRQRFEAHAQRLIAGLPATMPAAMVFIDLDNFKRVNDTGGHLTGDAMLRAAASAIASRVRAGDLAARLGGDEFVLLLERCRHADAVRVAEAIVASIAEIAMPSLPADLRIGASIGVASLTPQTRSVDAWLHAADEACYAAKTAGRGVVRAGSAPAERMSG